MGFDIECIVDINTYPGEYFCPVCRTLVYPNEALQAHCTHLYCKPCLAHIANGSKACPYDGYLVTESESKPLVDSDKTLAESIGKVKVHCLYFRSGCTWEGTLSDCISHCSGCSLGNSPVICNRCGIQIVHRQVHEHALSCPGAYEAQQVAGTVSGATGSSTTSTTTAEVNHTASQSGGPLSQSQNPQVVAATLMPAQTSAQQVSASSQTVVVAPGAVPTPEQWYQQPYQQYYQQYVGYEPYQQPNQQYYPLQQQPFQQYQQHAVHGQGQPQSHVQTQASSQVQLQPQQQPQLQPHLVHQIPQQHLQPQAPGQAQPQAQKQDQPHPQVQLLSQAQPLVPVLPQGQANVHAPFQASTANYQVNPQQQQQLHPPMRPPPQSLPPPPHGQPTPYSQATSTRPPVQHPQAPQYQQPYVQMHHPQATQIHAQPQMHPYLQPQTQPPPPPPAHTQTSNQSYVQPQAQLYHTQAQPHLRPSQPNQPNVPSSLPQVPHVSGHHSYQPPHPAQQMQSGLSQQHPMHPQPSSGSLQPVQVQGQVPQQPLAMRPPHSLGSLHQQQSSTPLPPQNQVSGIQPAQYQQFPHLQQPDHPLPHRPVVPVQQTLPPQYAQQPPFAAPFQVQLHQQGHFPQQPLQPPRPYGPPHPQQSQNYAGRPMMPSPGMHVHNNQQSSGRTGPGPLSSPAQLGSREASTNQNNSESTMLENTTKKEPEKGSQVEPVRTEAVTGQLETISRNEENGAKDGLVKPFIKQEGGGVDDSLEQASGGKILEGDEFCKEESDLLTNSNGLKQVDIQETKSSKPVIEASSSSNFDKHSHTVVSASITEKHALPPKSNGSHLEQPRLILGTQGPGNLPHPGQSFNPNEGGEHGYFGPPPKSLESQYTSQGPPHGALADPRGIIGRAPQPHLEGQFGPQHAVRSNETAMFNGQRLVEGGIRQTYDNEPSFYRMNGASGPIDKAPHGPNYDAGSMLDPGALGAQSRFLPQHNPSVGHSRMDNFGPGPEFGQHHMKQFAPGSPDREYPGISPRGFGVPAFEDRDSRETHRFGDGYRSFNLSSGRGNHFRDGNFPPLSGHLQRGEIGGPVNMRFDEHTAPRPLHNHTRNDDFYGQDGPGHSMGGEFSSPGYISGRFNTGEPHGPRAFPSHARMTELGGPGTFSGMRDGYSVQGFPNAAKFAGGVDSFDPSRKRRPLTTGWCRICMVDCETVEGLDMHSQTREHQNMALDMVKTIKQQNKKKQRASGGNIAHDGGRARRVGPVYCGNKY